MPVLVTPTNVVHLVKATAKFLRMEIHIVAVVLDAMMYYSDCYEDAVCRPSTSVYCMHFFGVWYIMYVHGNL